MHHPVPATSPAFWIGTWFGAGLSPKAPGTMGSLAALPFAWFLAAWGGSQALGGALVLVSGLGWWAAERMALATETADPQIVVVDEVAGLWLTLLAVPPDPWLYGLGFLLFRLLDIKKPWPVSWADRNVAGGLGIMLDDLIAGAIACPLVYAASLWRG